MKKSISELNTEFIKYRDRRDNPNEVHIKQLKGLTKKEIDELALTRYDKGSIPIDRVGDLSYLPMGIEGDFNGTIRVNGERQMVGCLEQDGRVAFLATYTDGFNNRIFYNVLSLSATGIIQQYEPKGKMYTNEFLDKNNLVLTSLIKTNGNECIIAGYLNVVDRSTGYVVIKTNGTLNPRFHVTSYLDTKTQNRSPSNARGYVLKDDTLYEFTYNNDSDKFTLYYYTLDFSRVGVDKYVEFVKNEKPVKSIGFPLNEELAEGEVKVFDRLMGYDGTDLKVFIKLYNMETIDLNASYVSIMGVPSPIENKIRMVLSTTKYYSKSGVGNYIRFSITIEFDISTRTYTLTNDSNKRPSYVKWMDGYFSHGGSASGGSDGGYGSRLYVQDHSTFSIIDAGGGRLIRAVADREEDMAIYMFYASGYRSLYEILGINADDINGKLVQIQSKSLPRYSPSYIAKNVNGFYRLNKDYVMVSTRSSVGLSGYAGYIVTKLEGDLNYVYDPINNYVGYKPSTYRKRLWNDLEGLARDLEYNTNIWDQNDNLTVYKCNFVKSTWNSLFVKSTFDGTKFTSTDWRRIDYSKVNPDDVFYKYISDNNLELFEPRPTANTNWALIDLSESGLPSFLHVAEYKKNDIGSSETLFRVTTKWTTDSNGKYLSELIILNRVASKIRSATMKGKWSEINAVANASVTTKTWDGQRWQISLPGVLDNSVAGSASTTIFRMIYDKASDKITDVQSEKQASWPHGTITHIYEPKLNGWTVKSQSFTSARSNSTVSVRKMGNSNTDFLNRIESSVDTRIYTLVSAKVAEGFVVYINENIPVSFSGDDYYLETGTIDLYGITNSPMNKTFYVYCDYKGSYVVLTLSLTKLEENDNRIELGYIKTGPLEIKEINLNKVTRVGGKRLSQVKAPNSILVTSGNNLEKGNLTPWYATKSLTDLTIGEKYKGGYYAGNITRTYGTFAIFVAPVDLCNKIFGKAYVPLYNSTPEADPLGESTTDGYVNTHCMMTVRITDPIHNVIDYEYAGHRDWYIPSVEEMKVILTNALKGSSIFNDTKSPEFIPNAPHKTSTCVDAEKGVLAYYDNGVVKQMNGYYNTPDYLRLIRVIKIT